jgi:hypothetical protein
MSAKLHDLAQACRVLLDDCRASSRRDSSGAADPYERWFLGGITGVMVAGTKGPLIQIKTSWPQRDENGVSTRV